MATRFDLQKLFDALEPQTPNREAKRDREDVVEVPSMAKGMTREALGQALLLGQGDDLEGYLTGRHPDDIRRERNAFADEHRLAANGAYAGGLLAGGAVPRVIKALAGAPRQQLDEMPPRLEPDLRQAMRNADKAAPADEAAAQMRSQLEMLLNSKLPPRPEFFPGAMASEDQSPADIFAMLAGSPQSAVPALSPEEQALQSMSPVDAVKFGQQLDQATPVSDEQRAKNLRTTGEDVLSVIPGPGNVLAARDAFQGGEDALRNFGEGNMGRGALDSAMAALSAVGAVTGMPTSRLAGKAAEAGKDSAAVFLPLPLGSMAADEVLGQRLDGRQLRDIYKDTGRFIGPDGTVRREIIDSRMRINPAEARAGNQTTLGQLVEHPELFEARPKYRDIPVTITDKQRGGHAIAQTMPDGSFENSVAGDMREGLAKNLQYQIARDDQLPEALRHGPEAIPNTIAAALRSLEGVPVESGADRRAVASYINKLRDVRDDYVANMAIADPKKQNTIQKNAGRKSAGNVDSRVVNARASFDADALPGIYPYSMNPPYFPRRTGKGVPSFEDIWTLPPAGASGEDLMEFIRSWHKYGAGRPPGVAD